MSSLPQGDAYWHGWHSYSWWCTPLTHTLKLAWSYEHLVGSHQLWNILSLMYFKFSCFAEWKHFLDLTELTMPVTLVLARMQVKNLYPCKVLWCWLGVGTVEALCQLPQWQDWLPEWASSLFSVFSWTKYSSASFAHFCLLGWVRLLGGFMLSSLSWSLHNHSTSEIDKGWPVSSAVEGTKL
jgi:hypothetical protein